jgi:hypothetical protein
VMIRIDNVIASWFRQRCANIDAISDPSIHVTRHLYRFRGERYRVLYRHRPVQAQSIGFLISLLDGLNDAVRPAAINGRHQTYGWLHCRLLHRNQVAKAVFSDYRDELNPIANLALYLARATHEMRVCVFLLCIRLDIFMFYLASSCLIACATLQRQVLHWQAFPCSIFSIFNS